MTIRENLIRKRQEMIEELINEAITSINDFISEEYEDLIDYELLKSEYEIKLGIFKHENCFKISLFHEVECKDGHINGKEGYINEFDSHELASEFAQILVAELFKNGVSCTPKSAKGCLCRVWNLKINLL